MAIFSLNHKAIGKSTQERPYTAAAHVHYVTRPKAMSRMDGARMPISKNGAAAFLRQAEDRDRVNGRVADKVMLALPHELNAEQRAALVRGYAEDVTKGRAPWLAAFHDKGKDAHNPHCHLLIRDRDPETGKRVYGMSEKGSTQRLRTQWEQHANRALEKANHPERIDHRSLEAQGKTRAPGIHVGPRSKAMQTAGRPPVSRRRSYANGPGARRRRREVDYPRLDRGRSRAEFNAFRLAPQTEREGWEAVDADRQRRELEALRTIHHPSQITWPEEVSKMSDRTLLPWQPATPESVRNWELSGGDGPDRREAQMSPITAGTNPELKKDNASLPKERKPPKKGRAPKPEKAPEEKAAQKVLKKAPAPSLDFLRPGTVPKSIPNAPVAALEFLKPAAASRGAGKAPMPDLKAPTRSAPRPAPDKDQSRKR